MYDAILKQIDPTSLILTPNNRLAEHLQLAAPLPIKTWLKNCWESLPHTKTLLTEFQELQIWQKLIAESSWGQQLLNMTATASLAQQAWQLMHEEDISLPAKSINFNEEVNQFIAWKNLFIDYCQAHHFISMSEIINELSKNLVNLTWPAKILLVNVDILPKQIAKFFTTLPSQVSFVNSTLPTEIECYYYPDPEAELQAMASWASQMQEQYPEATIHCVIPNLTTIRPQVSRIFKNNSLQSNISGGYKFSEAPLIHSALQLLQLDLLANPIDILSNLMTMPFIGAAEQELHARAVFEVILREANLPSLKWENVLSLAHANNCHKLASQLENYYLRRKQINNLLYSPREWVLVFQELLGTMGWPGERSLNSEEFQQQQRWELLLQELAQLEIIEPQLTYQQAVQKLTQLTNNTLFQAQTVNQSHVQVLGMLEAASLASNFCWVMGLHAGAWPNAQPANPFLPYFLQTPIDYAEKIIQRFAHSSKKLILSYPLQAQDHTLLMSPLLTKVLTRAPQAGTISKHPFNSMVLQQVLDEQAPALSMSDKINVRGGSNLFRDQAACPFRAFVRHRLHIQTVPETEFGLNSAERGTIIHNALEQLWGKLSSQTQLTLLSPDKLTQLIRISVQKALARTASLWEKLPAEWQQLETICLEKLLSNWLEYEKNRPPFTVIAREKNYSSQIGGLTISLKIDRIDELETGENIILDYKTGSNAVKPMAWLEARLTEPQLPLYCVSLPDFAGSLIAYINLREMKFAGITAEPCDIKGVTSAGQSHFPAWPELLQQWKLALGQLAEEFTAGVARVDPHDAKACEQCDLQSLCRIYEG